MNSKRRFFKWRMVAQKTNGFIRICMLVVSCSFLPAVAFAASGVKTIVETQQQEVKITGRIIDSTGEALIGATVAEKGTTNGTATDLDGKFSLSVSSHAILVVTYMGYITTTVGVESGKTDYLITLNEDQKVLDEVVVIGYGVQKKKLVTGATVQVSGDAIAKQSTTSAFTAMQSQMPGVNIIQNNGQPGEGFKVNIRGIGTVGDYQPLYIIDGVAGGDLNALNPTDIESIDVLKDAASAAIYGSRAANGVILVTTKQGKSGKIQVTYDGYYGIQNPYKLASLLDAQQYMKIQDELQFNQGLPGFDWQSILGPYYQGAIDGTWKGTNWLEESRNKNAPVQNHAFNITGGTDISTFSMGISYADQEGILGKPNTPHYGRTTFRINSTHVLLKGKGFDIIKVGENINYNHIARNTVSSGNQYGNDISQMLRAMPIMPVRDSEGNYFDYDDNREMGLQGFDGQMANPIGVMASGKGESKNYALNAAINLEIQPIKHLIFKSQFGYRMTSNKYRSFGAPYHMSTTSERKNSTVEQNMSSGWNYTIDNTLNYTFDVASVNHFDVLIGQSAEKWGMGEYLRATNGELVFDDFKHAYLDNSTKTLVAGQASMAGYPWGQGALASFFGRVNYSYNETYMMSLIARTDGSSNFGRGHRWGYFPSVSAGWVVTNEAFMEPARDIVDFLKIRASWGQNGNSKIDNFHYLSLISMGATGAYSFGNNVDAQQTGGWVRRLQNLDITWETSEQFDLGLDARFLNSRLGVVLDYYVKTTKDWLLRAPIVSYYGMGSDGAPYINGGAIENKGLEVGLNWNDHVANGLTYGASLNLTYNHNEVTRIDNAEQIYHGKANEFTQGTSEMYRAQVGYPIGYFWGYKTAGIFQNQADIDAWRATGDGILQANVQPGDIKFVDRDHNGIVNDLDKTQIGNPLPDFKLGFNFNLGYKGADLSLTTYGAFGQQIAKNYRKYADSPKENYGIDVYQRWHGEGTSNKWPRLTPGSGENYINVSDIFIEDADYLKIQDITVGYDLKSILPKLPLGQLRFYFKLQNPYTFTKYSGMDPEVGFTPSDHDWAQGLDLGNYPYPRTYLFGVNIKF
jgi:TonB-linked SusC/RagA family outer membrane protein